jgi:hypothetical protein
MIIITILFVSVLLVPSSGFCIHNHVMVKNGGVQLSHDGIMLGVSYNGYRSNYRKNPHYLKAANSDESDDKLVSFLNNSQKPTQQEVADIVDELEATKPSTFVIIKDVSILF